MFTSDNASRDTSKKATKEGHHAAAAVAIAGLSEEVALERAIPTVSLVVACGQHFVEHVRIVESNDYTWGHFWADPPSVVGVDVEGNGQSPPCLVQIATSTTVILEAPMHMVKPDAPEGRRLLSHNLRRLLDDDSIIKVFCDSRSQADKRSLGLSVPSDMRVGHIVDIECISAERMGHGGSFPDRGLARIFSESYSLPCAGVRVTKPGGYGDIKRFARIERGHLPQLTSVWSLSKKEREYAAMDAWVTLVSWVHLTHDGTQELPPWSIIDMRVG